MKKNVLKKLLVIFTMISCLGISAIAQSEIKVYVDDVKVEFDVQPQLIGGRTMVPLRAIFESLGATVEWNGDTQTITAYNEAYYVEAVVGQTSLKVNNEEKQMDISPMIIDGRTLVPARFVAESFDCDVDWDGDEKTVSITTKPIDYNNLEQKTNNTTVSDNKSDNQEEIASTSTTSTSKYYSGTNVPDYTAVTGIKLNNVFKQSGGAIYQYPYTQSGEYSEAVDYMAYLIECGWSEYSTKEERDHISWYYTKYTKDLEMVGVSYYPEYDEIWISVITK